MTIHPPAKRPYAVLVIVVVWAVSVMNAEEPQRTGILRPTDQSVLETEEVQIIARAGELRLDGKSLKERQEILARQAISIQVATGKHELVWKNGDLLQKIQFAVTTPSKSSSVPSGWKVYRAHPPQAECQTCHAAQTANFQKSTIAETCFTCHEQKVFAAGHTHNDEVLAECVLCHNPHGSSEKFHLKMNRETACKHCHG